MGLFSCLSAVAYGSSASSTRSSTTLHDDEGPTKPRRDDEEAPHHMDTSDRLYDLRGQMKDQGIEVYDCEVNRLSVIPTADAHGSEYVGDCDKRRAWISGFTGSAGVAVVTMHEAHLFTDSRYYVQAAKQLDSNWTLQKVGLDKVKNWNAWLLDLPQGTKVGMDPSLLDYATAKPLLSDLTDRGLSVVFPSTNLVDSIWTDRPPRSTKPIVAHPLKFSGQPASDKIANLRKFLVDEVKGPGARSFLITSLSPIAWILNLRGSDIDFNPIFYAYLLVTQDEVVLWTQDEAVTGDMREAVECLGGRIERYDRVIEDLKQFEGKVVTDSKVNWEIVEAIGSDNITIVKSPVETAQAIKNATEIEGFRRAYLRDGAAWARWGGWLEEELKKRQVTEWEAAEKLTEYRSKNENFAGLAYENISATGENAALPHYAPSRDNPIPISLKTPYLNDSGAQYLDGTIDTTRTVHFGRPTREQKRAFTRVLQGHIAIDRLVFPEGTTGSTIDVLARSPLWSDGMNYGHGTGHGIMSDHSLPRSTEEAPLTLFSFAHIHGEYLSVHETQVGISGSTVYANVPFVPGHITSNEPAYYETGSYGIRLESVVGVREVKTRRDWGDRKWFGFERFTTVPIQTKMVDFKLLSPDEARWLKEHNATCMERLLPLVKHDKRAVRWLAKQ
ncbi:hypothetical protein JCM10212_006288 [Sporobolomyces blumeae]